MVQTGARASRSERASPECSGSRGLLAEEFARIEGEGFSLDRTILSGFSQGCLMTLEFGARFPKRLAGYLGISGYCYDPELLLKEASAEARSGSWFITHGTQDEVLSAETTRGQIAVLKGGGMPIDYREYRKAHTIDPHRELPEIREWIRARIEGKD
jgi:phospholipase/carboxylesterase